MAQHIIWLHLHLCYLKHTSNVMCSTRLSLPTSSHQDSLSITPVFQLLLPPYHLNSISIHRQDNQFQRLSSQTRKSTQNKMSASSATTFTERELAVARFVLKLKKSLSAITLTVSSVPISIRYHKTDKVYRRKSGNRPPLQQTSRTECLAVMQSMLSPISSRKSLARRPLPPPASAKVCYNTSRRTRVGTC